jgi:hypothetical protein
VMSDSSSAARSESRVQGLPGHRLVQHTAQTVHIAPAIELDISVSLLRAHVHGSPHGRPHLGQVTPAGGIDRARHPKWDGSRHRRQLERLLAAKVTRSQIWRVNRWTGLCS